MALIRLSNIERSFQDGEDRENNVLRGINMEVEKEFPQISVRARLLPLSDLPVPEKPLYCRS